MPPEIPDFEGDKHTAHQPPTQRTDQRYHLMPLGLAGVGAGTFDPAGARLYNIHGSEEMAEHATGDSPLTRVAEEGSATT